MNAIRLLRKRFKVTQDQLANHLGITQSYLSMLERGERRIDLDLAVKIAAALGCSVDDLIVKESK